MIWMIQSEGVKTFQESKWNILIYGEHKLYRTENHEKNWLSAAVF